MKLHFHPASPFARMVLVTAHELGIAGQITPVPVGMMHPGEVNASVARDNPLGKIPTLVTDHGHPLYDSRVICEYLCHHAGDKKLLPDEPVKRFRILTLQALAQGICEAGVAVRYETVMRPKELLWDKFVSRQTQRMVDALDDIEGQWSGDLGALTAGSLAVGCALGYLDFRFDHMKWREGRPKSAAVFEEFGRRPSMAATMPSA